MREKKFRRCRNILYQSCCVCVCNSVMTKSFSSTQSQTHEQTWVCTRPMEGSPGFQRWCSCEAVRVSKVQNLRWEVRKKSSSHVAVMERLEATALDDQSRSFSSL